MSANLAADRSTWRAGKTTSVGFERMAADTREKAGAAMDRLGTLLRERERSMIG